MIVLTGLLGYGAVSKRPLINAYIVLVADVPLESIVRLHAGCGPLRQGNGGNAGREEQASDDGEDGAFHRSMACLTPAI